MNSYFVAHPEMVLGDTVEESTAYGMDITVRPIEGMELSELLKEAVSHIQGTYQAVELPEADKGKEIETIPATPDVKNFSYTVVDGNVYFRENSLMRRVDLNEKAKDRVMGMVELRGIVNELIEYQLEDYPDEMITQKQAELNDAYDAFAAKNGLIKAACFFLWLCRRNCGYRIFLDPPPCHRQGNEPGSPSDPSLSAWGGYAGTGP